MGFLPTLQYNRNIDGTFLKVKVKLKKPTNKQKKTPKYYKEGKGNKKEPCSDYQVRHMIVPTYTHSHTGLIGVTRP